MSAFVYDAFVSYPRTDEGRVKPLVQALGAAGLRIFWDQMIYPGQDWAREIERAIAASRCTLVCLSPAATASNFVAAETSRSVGKIIPVYLENTDLPLIWEAHLGRIQRADLSRSRFAPDDPAFAQLCAVLAGRLPTEQVTGDEPPEARARRLIEKSSIADRSLIIALSVLGGASKDDISVLAADLEDHFRALAPHAQSSEDFVLESFSARLKRVGAETFDRVSRFGVKIECAWFIEKSLGHTILALIWSDYEILRAPILNWIREWSTQSPLWIRLRLALNLGILAQDERRFDPIWRLVLRPMLFDNARRRGRAAAERFEVADAALSIAALDPSRSSTVEAILNEMISDKDEPSRLKMPNSYAGKGPAPTSSQSNRVATTGKAPQTSPEGAQPLSTAPNGSAHSNQPAAESEPPSLADADGNEDLAGGGSEDARIYLVARLAFGFTGARFPDLAVTALRRLIDAGKFNAVTNILSRHFQEKMSVAKGVAEGGLWDPILVLDGLLRWAEDVPPRDQAPPLIIFLLGLADLPLVSDQDDQLSLTSIMMSKRGIRVIRRGFLLGLAHPDTRGAFEERLREWRDAQRQNQTDPDPVLALAFALVDRAPTARDEARVRFLFRNCYDDATIKAQASKFPALDPED